MCSGSGEFSGVEGGGGGVGLRGELWVTHRTIPAVPCGLGVGVDKRATRTRRCYVFMHALGLLYTRVVCSATCSAARRDEKQCDGIGSTTAVFVGRLKLSGSVWLFMGGSSVVALKYTFTEARSGKNDGLRGCEIAERATFRTRSRW